jgi:hypothetical protein
MSNTLIDGLRERMVNAVGMNHSVGVVLPSNNYNDLTQALFDLIKEKNDAAWVYVTIANPFDSLKDRFASEIDPTSVFFIDCVSRAAGIQSINDQCLFLDSPSELERLILEIVNAVKTAKADTSFVVLDSLSSLVLYNDVFLVSEFFTHLMNNIRIADANTLSLCIEEEMDEVLNKVLYLKNDKIIKVRESFI